MTEKTTCPGWWRRKEISGNHVRFCRRWMVRRCYGVVCMVLSVWILGFRVPVEKLCSSSSGWADILLVGIPAVLCFLIGGYLALGRCMWDMGPDSFLYVSGMPWENRGISLAWCEIQDVRVISRKQGRSLYEDVEDGRQGLSDLPCDATSSSGMDGQGKMYLLVFCLKDGTCRELNVRYQEDACFFQGYLMQRIKAAEQQR